MLADEVVLAKQLPDTWYITRYQTYILLRNPVRLAYFSYQIAY